LPVYGDGDNIIPIIYLNDLSNIIVEVIETNPPSEYILAVDGSKSTQVSIIRVKIYVRFQMAHYLN
jgi:adenylate kinase